MSNGSSAAATRKLPGPLFPRLLGLLAGALIVWAGLGLRSSQHDSWREQLQHEDHRLARILAREANLAIAEARFAFEDVSASPLAAAVSRADPDSTAILRACLVYLRAHQGVGEIYLADSTGQVLAAVQQTEREMVPVEQPQLKLSLATACRQARELLPGESFSLRCDRLAVDDEDRPDFSDPHLVFAAPLYAATNQPPSGCVVGSFDMARLDALFGRSLWSDPRRSVALFDRDGQLLLGEPPLPAEVRELSQELPSGGCILPDAAYSFAWLSLPRNARHSASQWGSARPRVPKRGRPGKDWLLIIRHALVNAETGLSDERSSIDKRNGLSYGALLLAVLLAAVAGLWPR